MQSSSRLPHSVSIRFRNRVRQACVKAALNGEPVTYQFLAETAIGNADWWTNYRRFIRLVTEALLANTRHDAKAGRPLSAVAVRQNDELHLPGDEFFTLAWELGRFGGDQDGHEFVEHEWNKFRRYVLCNEPNSQAQPFSLAAA